MHSWRDSFLASAAEPGRVTRTDDLDIPQSTRATLANAARGATKSDAQGPRNCDTEPMNREIDNRRSQGYHEKPLYERLSFLWSDLPAFTHIDYSARVQSVS